MMILAGATLFAVIAVMACVTLIVGARRDRRFRRRVILARGETPFTETERRSQGAALPVRMVGAIGRGISRSGILPASTVAELQLSLTRAGLRDGSWLSVFIGAKIVLLIACPLAALLVTRELAMSSAIGRLAPFLAGIVGLLLPDKILSTVRTRYRNALEQGVPDALDLMVICTQAGLGLTATMHRVASEIGYAHPHVARELAETVSELQIAVDSAAALVALGTRTDLDGFKRVARTLVQSTQYGTPLAEALRSLAGEMRQEALTRYEEKAARLPVMLTIPMIIFILPCVFIIVGGPAVLQIGKAFHH
ncbi:MAG: type II secretion system F family protein [Proteobacteria bacterium]|nr:type II secretion system F family protein [Pseudomonadota bacterium]